MKYHQTVLLNQVIANVDTNAKKAIDATVGTGGHTLGLLERGMNVLGIEADPRMHRIAGQRLENYLKSGQLELVLDNFSNLKSIAKKNAHYDLILMDLGVSNLHLTQDKRGFSFSQRNHELDMRLDTRKQAVKASDLLNALDKTQLTLMFSRVMNIEDSRKLASRVVVNRPFETVGDLKDVAFDLGKNNKLDSATLPMLALRIAVNSELFNLESVLPQAYELLEQNGKLMVITFHSAEDKVLMNSSLPKPVIILPDQSEVRNNPSSRSAKLYVYRKI